MANGEASKKCKPTTTEEIFPTAGIQGYWPIMGFKVWILFLAVFDSPQCAWSQLASIDTVYYSNDQIHQIISRLEGDSVKIVKRFYSQYERFEEGGFYLGKKKKDRLEAIETYIRYGGGVYRQDGYSEYWHKNGNKRLEIIYSRKNGNRYLNQWKKDETPHLINGNGYYTTLDIGINGVDSLRYEVKDSLLHGEHIRYAKDEAGQYFIRAAQSFAQNKAIDTKVLYDSNKKMIRRDRYYSDPDSVFIEVFDDKEQITQSGLEYKNLKTGLWKYHQNGELVDERYFDR
ncbi:MAG: hypothetical protein AAFP19_08615 [Bacteroidota bacterium]